MNYAPCRTFRFLCYGLIGWLATSAFGCSISNNNSDSGGADTGAGDIATTDSEDQQDTSMPEAAPLPHELSSIAITPLNHIYQLDLNTAGSISYSAKGNFQDYTEQDLSATVTWSVEDESMGSFDGSTLNIAPIATAGARTTLITAKLGKIESKAQLTVVAYRQSGDKTDFFFVLPYQDKEGDQKKPLDFKTDVRSLDVFFAMDTTGSMRGAIDNLKSSVVDEIIKPMSAQIPDSQFGVGRFDDFPISSYGDDGDQPFALITSITGDVAAVSAGVGKLNLHNGDDTPESMIEALYQVATGEGLDAPPPTSVAPNHDGIGGVAYREGSMPVVVPISDAPSHTVGDDDPCSATSRIAYEDEVAAVAHSRQQTKDALDKICAKVVGISTSGGDNCNSPTSYMTDFANHTGARIPPSAWDTDGRPTGCEAGQCCTEKNGTSHAPDADGLCPLVFQVDGSGNGLGASIITGLKMLTRYGTFNVLTEKEGPAQDNDGNALPEGKTTADFIKSVLTKDAQKPSIPTDLPEPIAAGDHFERVTPGTKVTFDVVAFNDFVQPTDKAQFFRAKIKVLAGGCTDLDERDILILVPPEEIDVLK